MSAICKECHDEINRWIDAFQDYGPITRWRQFNTSPEAERVRSAEMRRARVDDRAALIRRQIKLVGDNCRHLDQAVAA